MKWLLSSENELTLESKTVVLRKALPMVNGLLLTQSEIKENTTSRLELRYTTEVGHFGLELVEDVENSRIWLRYWLENLADDFVLNSFGLKFAAVENLRAYLRQGYTSWDGSDYVQPEAMGDFASDEPRPETGYAMTQILPRNGRDCLILGFDRHDRYQQTFTFNTRQQPCSLTIQTWWDQKNRANLPRCESERLVIFSHKQVEAALRQWAWIVAAASPTPPRVPGRPLIGWCSWYNLYANITEKNILEHLHGITAVSKQEKFPMSIFQIDDGFTPEIGDWLAVKPQFPRGIKPLLDDIRTAGFIPGLWIAPFMVGNRSQLYQDHPDWVLQDIETEEPLIQMRFYGEFRWHKRSEEYYILDTTHPEAFAYLRQVFRIWRQEWGCGYFKTDFMHFGVEHGPDRVRWHTPGLTRIEIWRRTAEMIREEIGDALWLGCGCPLWVPVGLVDGVRIGRDVSVTWVKGLSAQSLIRDQATRNFVNHILWQSDPDCVLLRNRFHHLTDAEIRSLALFAGMAGGVLMTSDQLNELVPERLALWRLLLSWIQSGCEFPLLGQTEIVYERFFDGKVWRHEPNAVDPVVVQVRQPQTENEAGVIFVFNTGERQVQRSYDLAQLGISKPVYLDAWGYEEPLPEKTTRISLTLPAHDGKMFFFSNVRSVGGINFRVLKSRELLHQVSI
jgi:alpha-galactosidase